jgi:proteasome lid subunit RPN8/RPN11
VNRILLARHALAALHEHLLAAYPEEGCGLLLGRDLAAERRVEEAVGVENVGEGARRQRYTIDPERFLEIEKRARSAGLEVIGFFHSHPDHPATPSDFDREGAWPYYSYVIASVSPNHVGEIRSWRLREDGSGFDAEELIVVEPTREATSPRGSE